MEKKVNLHNIKKILLLKLQNQIPQLDLLAADLLGANREDYYEKVLKIKQVSLSLTRILNKLDVEKPYAKEVIKGIKEQTNSVAVMLVKMYEQ